MLSVYNMQLTGIKTIKKFNSHNNFMSGAQFLCLYSDKDLKLGKHKQH